MRQNEQQPIDFQSIRLKIASPEDIHRSSYGEVVKPETINYRTQKPEKGGLFAEEIFGPTKDWECYCGKYKRIRYKGIVCDKCGVEVTRAAVRRERMGHIDLAAPVSHIWFLRGVPSKIGLVLDLSVADLEKVIYFANFIVTRVDDQLRKETLEQIDQEFASKKQQLDKEFQRESNEIRQRQEKELSGAGDEKAKAHVRAHTDDELATLTRLKEEKLKTLEDAVDAAKRELKELMPFTILTENQYQDLSLKYGHVFEAAIGAEAIRKLLSEVDLKKTIEKIREEAAASSENKRKRLNRRIRLMENLQRNDIHPEWMILTSIPVIPPDLRPMVQLDGGRFATSDLNDLYRRVINRNNRLKRLIELNAPEVIQRNEKRMLQEAVDALIDNSARHGKTVTASTGQKRMLKSIADMLKGKQGRFRQNLLGKRVDYSGRSVIVIGAHLRLNQCGLPKQMALELFRPFVISKLIKREYVHNVRSASRFIEAGHDVVWDILEEITKKSHVLLNRAPTLHRLGIQAFQPVLIEGKAIQIHPMVCAAFNADFDGDQMAVHVPLTEQAKWEAENLMLSTKNILKPATGKPVATPTQDIVLGCFYLTNMKESEKPKHSFTTPEEAVIAYHLGHIAIQDNILVRMKKEVVETSVGRILFNEILPPKWPFLNKVLDKKALSQIVADSLNLYGAEETVKLLDAMKNLAFGYLTVSGISWGMDDLPIPAKKQQLLEEAAKRVDEVRNHYEMGLLTDDERHVKTIEIWAEVKDQITEESKKALEKHGPVYAMIGSGARGSWGQITQMMGMKGLVTNPAGETIELPVKGSFKEGFDVLEYFISTHGARKGLSDTALRTASAGYLTRRLIDVAQDVVIREEDCKEKDGYVITKQESEEMDETVATRAWGRVVMDDVKKGSRVVIKAGELIDDEKEKLLEELDPEQLRIRSILTCKSTTGVCQLCYGADLSNNQLVDVGVAVGIIAAQSIGEPGTQLTMRTFHTGGVAGEDITQGLPRVEELFEARPVKRQAILSEIDGRVSIEEQKHGKLVRVFDPTVKQEVHRLTVGEGDWDVKVETGKHVRANQILASRKGERIKATQAGTIELAKGKIILNPEGMGKEYEIPAGYSLYVKEGDLVTSGDALTEGSINLFDLYRLKGQDAVERYIIKEIHYIYSSQGQKVNAKHLEVIVRQMFSRVTIDEPNDSTFLTGEVIEKSRLIEENKRLKKEGKKQASFTPMLLGITKASLSTESFLSAASFQETARVLIDAAVSGRVDELRGLKENVIIGKLIPAGTGLNPEKIVLPEREVEEPVVHHEVPESESEKREEGAQGEAEKQEEKAAA